MKDPVPGWMVPTAFGGGIALMIALAFSMGAQAQDKPRDLAGMDQHSSAAVKAAWLVESDHPDKKVIVRLDALPDDFVFEFWFGSDAPHITKAQLAEALEMYQARRIQSDKTCVITAQGGILNYPCKVRSASSHTAAAKK
jgi:hypothetical protein